MQISCKSQKRTHLKLYNKGREGMTQIRKRALSLLAVLGLLLSLSVNAAAADSALDRAVSDTAAYLYQTAAEPQVGSIGGEWAVMGLARSGWAVPAAYYQKYYQTVENYVKARDGVLHTRKYTEYSRVIVALSALGKDARNVAGYDLTKPLGDFDKTVWQGINGPIWALIALDSRNYPMPQNPEAAKQATRQMYVEEILARQLDNGGWDLGSRGGSAQADADITGMALQALAKYRDQAAVKAAVDRGLACLSAIQDASGGYACSGTVNSNSTAQAVTALCELGIRQDDPRFVKNGHAALDNLLSFYRAGKGFSHTAGGSSDQMATEQAFYAMVAVQRANQGKNSLYRMSDAADVLGTQPAGLPGRNADVQVKPVTEPGKTFGDISGHRNQTAIEALASRSILNGYDAANFGPDHTLTRAQFAAIVVRALGLPLETADNFTDVKAADWFAAYVGTAYRYGIVNGTTATTFHPYGTITRQEAAAMAARAARLCGMDTAMEVSAVRSTLEAFSDYGTTGEWARESLAFCYRAEILDGSAGSIRPRAAVTRCEFAQMLYNLLGSAQLL